MEKHWKNLKTYSSLPAQVFRFFLIGKPRKNLKTHSPAARPSTTPGWLAPDRRLVGYHSCLSAEACPVASLADCSLASWLAGRLAIESLVGLLRCWTAA